MSVEQSGPVTPFHPAAWFGNGVIADGGNSTAPFLDAVGLFDGANAPFSISSQPGPGVDPTPHSQFSITQTDETTTFNFLGVNGNPTPNVEFNIGGVVLPFPGPADDSALMVNVLLTGAKGDLIELDGAGTIGGATSLLTAAGPGFVPTDIGKYITVYGAGAGGVSLYTRISAWISATQVVLATPATSSVTNATVIYGTGNAGPFGLAIDAAKEMGIPVFIPGGKYYLENTVVNTGVTIQWAGPEALVWRQGLGYAFTNPFTLPVRQNYLLTNSPINSTVLTFANPANTAFFKVDAYALIGSNAAYDRPILDPQRRGEYVRIKAIDSGAGTVTLYDALMDDYLIADAPQLIPVTLTENVRYRNPSIKMDITVPVVGGGDPNSELRNAIQTMYALRPRIDGARIQWAVGAGLSFEGCVGWMVSDYEAHDLGSAVNSDGTNPNGLGGYGYAIIERGLNFGGTAWGMYHERVRHGYTCGGSYIFTLGRPVGATIAVGTVWGAKVSGWDTHEIGFGITFVALKSFGAQGPGFTIRCDSVKLNDIGAYYCLGAIIAYFQGATENAQNCVADGVYGIGNNWGTDAQGNIWTGQPTIFDSGTNNTTMNVVVDSAYGPLFAAEANAVNPTFKNFKAKNLNLSGANYAIYQRSINALVAIGSANITSVSNVGSLYAGMAVDPSITGLTTSTVASVNVGAATAVLSDPSVLAGVHTISPNGIVRIRDGDIDCTNGMITDLVRCDSTNSVNVPQVSNVIPTGVFSGLWYNAINQATNQLVNWTGSGLLGIRTAVTLNGSTDLPLAGLTHFRFSVSKTTAETLATASGRALEGALLEIIGGTTGIVVTNNNIATPDTFVCQGNTNLSLTTSQHAMFERTGVQWVQVPTV